MQPEVFLSDCFTYLMTPGERWRQSRDTAPPARGNGPNSQIPPHAYQCHPPQLLLPFHVPALICLGTSSVPMVPMETERSTEGVGHLYNQHSRLQRGRCLQRSTRYTKQKRGVNNRLFPFQRESGEPKAAEQLCILSAPLRSRPRERHLGSADGTGTFCFRWGRGCGGISCPSPARQEKSWEGSRCGTGQGTRSPHTQAAQFTPCRVRTAKTTQRNRVRSQTAPLPGRKGQTGGLQQHKHHPMSIKKAPGEEQPRPDSRAAAPAVCSQVPKRVSFSHQNPQRFEVPSRKPCRTHCGAEQQQVPDHKRLHHRHCVAKNSLGIPH